MSTGIWSAASGAAGQSAALDVAANNIANATTPGYRADEAVFRQELARAGTARGARPSASLRYTTVRTTAPNQAPGAIVHTGRPLDVALRDDTALFAVQTPDGERYTRAGCLRVGAGGQLVYADGVPYLGENRRPITVPPGTRELGIAPDGGVVADGQRIGSLLTVRFANQQGLEKVGSVLFRAAPTAGAPERAGAQMEGGALEMSNGSAVGGMTTLVNVTRHFEMLTKVIEAFSQIDEKAAREVMGKR